MFIHGLTRQVTDEVGLRAVSKGEGLGQLIEGLGTDRTLGVELFCLVTLTSKGVKEPSHQQCLYSEVKGAKLA